MNGLGTVAGAVRRTIAVSGLAAALIASALLTAGVAAAAPVYTVRANWGDTHLPPGGQAEFTLHVRNVGTSVGSGPLSIKDQLPSGVTIIEFSGVAGGDWDPATLCTGAGTRNVNCTVPPSKLPAPPGGKQGFLGPGPDGHLALILVKVAVGSKALGTGTNVATVSGGGALKAASDIDEVPFDSTPAPFGIVPGSFEQDGFDKAFPFGIAERQAGARPFELRTNFDFNSEGAPNPTDGVFYTSPRGRVRTVEATLPVGLIGNPEATPKCDPQLFAADGAAQSSTGCPPDTQVGYINLDQANGTFAHGRDFWSRSPFNRIALYNLEPPVGVPADFGFKAGGLVLGHIYPSLDAGAGYAIKALSPHISNLVAIRRVEVTFWGVPGDPAHDAFRYHRQETSEGNVLGAEFGSAAIRPMLTNPMDCGVDNGGSRITADSWNNPGHFIPALETKEHLEVEGCDDPRIRFEPDIALQPTSRVAGGPTGLTVDLKVPQRDDAVADASELYAPNGDVQAIPTPPLKKAVVTLPDGMTLSTSAAQGLGGCTPAQIGLGTDRPVRCPENSRYGALTLHTPILPKDEPMRGDIYIAQQNQNPFKTFLAMYFVIHDESRGLLVKLPGRIDLDPKTGQIRTTFDDLPQFPVSNMQLSLKGGVRAGLVNPSTCGQKTITAEFYSWHDPGTPITRTSSYAITHKANGSPCVSHLGERPFNPELSAGTVNPNAGSYSPFVFRLERTDDDQEFSQLSTTLPPGLLANISKVSECPEAGIAQAQAKGRTGNQEKLFPSCPTSSLLGTTDVGSGVGQVITYIPGKAYLAGPYKGQPLSMVVITPITAGPYDLGVIAVRSAIHVDAERGQATIATDPFPQIYEGIPVRIRDIRVKADRDQTILNPTSCDPMAVTARVTGTGGDLDSAHDDTVVDLQNRFQAANCASLGFKPKLTFRLKGATKRGGFPAFSALLRARPGDANIARTQVLLPRSTFIAQQHIDTVCTRVQFAAKACPVGSVYGSARARSPLFDEVLSGPVYLRANGGERLLPDLVVLLDGKIEVVLTGFVDSVKERVRNTFNVIPDAPVTYFALQMKGGGKGLLENSRNLCRSPSRANVRINAQNGKRLVAKTKLAVSCKSKKQRGRKAKR